jgi:hypothetical protein
MEKFSMTLVCNPQLQEHLDHEFGAQYDDIRERYASEIRDLEIDNRMTAWHNEYMQKVYDAGYGDDDQAYEASWKRTEAYFEEHNLN